LSFGLFLAERLAAFDALIERHKFAAALTFSASFCIICGLIATTKLMWYDELATYYPAQLPTVGSLLRFFADGLDLHTPVASLLLRADIRLFGDSALAMRIPMIAGYLVMCLCVFVFVSRRTPAVYAAAAMIFPAVASALYYATEIRPYALVLGLTGIAMVCWQQAAEGGRRAASIVCLFLSLAVADSMHFYAILLCIPFGLAELVRDWQRRRIDVPIWLALVLSPASMLIFLPGMLAARSRYGHGLWSPPRLSQFALTYEEVLALAFVPMVIAALLWLLLVRFERSEPDWRESPPAAEWVLTGSLGLLPLFALSASYFSGLYVTRYSLPMLAGIAVFLAFSVCWGLRGDRLAGSILVLVLGIFFLRNGVGKIRGQIAGNGGLTTPLGRPYENSAWMKALQDSSLPVTATPEIFFMQLQRYAPQNVRSRITYMADEQRALKYQGVFSNDTNMLLFRQRLPIPVQTYHDYLATHSHFLICANTVDRTWLLSALTEDGVQLRLLTRSGSFFVFDAIRPKGTALWSAAPVSVP
jgi:hypothetical protein